MVLFDGVRMPHAFTMHLQSNFEKLHFSRGAPQQAYRLGTKARPHRYANYYADFTLYQRLELVMDLITRERAHGASDDLRLLR